MKKGMLLRKGKNARLIGIVLLAGLLTAILSVSIFQTVFFQIEKGSTDLRLAVCGEKNEKSMGYDVRIKNILADEQAIDLNEIALNAAGWMMEGELLCTYQGENTAPIELNIDDAKIIKIQFYGQEGSGIVEIQSNRKNERIDLYHAGDWKLIEWTCKGGQIVLRPHATSALLLCWFVVFFVMLRCSKKEDKKLRAQYTWIMPACCVATLAALVMVYGCVWETNDDSTISFLLSRTNNDYCPFIGHIISYVLQSMYAVCFTLNWWLIIQLTAIALGTLEILYVLCKRFRPVMALLVALSVCGMVLYTAIRTMNFTRSSILLATGSVMLVADAVLFKEKFGKGAIIEFLCGCLSLLAAQQIRADGVWVALAGLAAAGLSVMLTGIRAFSFEGIKPYVFKGMLLWVTVGVAVGGICVEQMMIGPEEQAFLEYNHNRSRIEDYSSRYTDYEENGQNLSKEDLKTFLKWYSEDPSIFNNETLNATVKSGHAATQSSIIPKLRNVVADNRAYLLTTLFCIVFLLSQMRKRNIRHWVAALLPAMVGCALVVYLLRDGRLPTRVFQPICFVVSVICLMLGGSGEKDNGETAYTSVSRRQRSCGYIIACIGMLLATVFYPKLDQIRALGCLETDRDTPQNEALEYVNTHPENTYFFSIEKSSELPAESCGIWKTVPEHYCDNLFYLGGWTARIPYKLRMLEERGITNPTLSLLEDDSTYTVMAPSTTDFLRRNYGEYITVSGITEAGNDVFVQYTRPIPDGQMSEKVMLAGDLHIEKGTLENTEGWRIAGKAEQATDETLYCNVSVDGIRYTYRVKTDENGDFSAFLYEIPKEADPEMAGIALYRK